MAQTDSASASLAPIAPMEAAPAGATVPGPDRASAVPSLVGAAVIIAGLYFGRELVMPLVLAGLLSFVLAPLANMLRRRARLPHTASVLLSVLAAFALLGGIGWLVGTQGANLAASLPRYQATIEDKVRSFSVVSEVVGRLVASAEHMITGNDPAMAPPDQAPQSSTSQPAPAANAPASTAATPSTIAVVRTVIEPLLGPLATAGIVLVFVIFILLSQETLRDRVVRLSGRQDLHRTILAMNDAARRLSQYFVMQLLLNAGFGLYVGLALWMAGLPNPVLWGLLACVMRFVPFIGTALALIPPILLALAISPGWWLAIVVLAIMLGGDIIMAQVLEPLFYGHSTGISPIAVIIAAAFWALLWGPIGLLMSTPLTVCLVVLGRHVESLSFLYILFSDAEPLAPSETFYQRALENKAADLARQAALDATRAGRTDYFDHVAIPGLSLAQFDLSRDALDLERLDQVHAQIETLLATLAASGPPAKLEGRTAPPTWSAPGSVLCIPGRGQLDDLAATMAVQSLSERGFGATILPNAALGGEVPGAADVRLCCISALDGGSSAASIRFFLRRVQKRLPGIPVVVGLWHAQADSATLATLREEGGDEFIVLSVGELLALATAVSARQKAAA